MYVLFECEAKESTEQWLPSVIEYGIKLNEQFMQVV